MGAPNVVGLSGSAAASGFAPVMFEWQAIIALIALGWIFAPIYLASGTYTMPEFLQKRFGGARLRICCSIAQLLIGVITGISMEIYAASIFLHKLLGWNVYLSTVIILVITAIYTIGGGLTAVIYTDTLQAVILVVGTAVVSVKALMEVGGYNSMLEQFQKAASNMTYVEHQLYNNLSCGFPPADSFHVFRSTESDFPWPGVVFGMIPLAIYCWCTQQVIVQRNLSAKTVIHSKVGCLLAGYLKILPFFLFIIPGMISRILYPDDVACSSPEICQEKCGNPAGCTNIAYPMLVLNILPKGVKGLMLAALLSALMSSLTSYYNSGSSLFTLDIYSHFRKKASEHEKVLVGRLFGLFLVCLSVAWLPILQSVQGNQLWNYTQAIYSYLTPPWTVVYLLGMFWTRATEQGAWWGLIVGLVAGLIRMGLDFSYKSAHCGGSEIVERPDILERVHFLVFAVILCAITFIVMVAVSFITQGQSLKELERVTWWTRKSKLSLNLTDGRIRETETSLVGLNEENNSSSSPVKKHPLAWRAYAFMCGATLEDDQKIMSEEERMKVYREMTNVNEDPFWSRVCDINALILLAILCFLFGFFS
ncbi:hypothetical protein HELRODRAFT_174010 [Helobdella robusta]|uniref:Sodium/glucose cotransporter 4 n=1 Tax=Helobdella robusta TaxID=6412 RepID=T1F7H1_HELRO|nr:hypothetical protein HELRODRAFT_174010 [Helobdella robusta]ESO03121.1 hypothetical protein HELRODRAFT_174010 [Helobdella robusta]